jgi:hypothetical protein
MCAGSMGWMAWCDRYGANLFENSTTDMGTQEPLGTACFMVTPSLFNSGISQLEKLIRNPSVLLSINVGQ